MSKKLKPGIYYNMNTLEMIEVEYDADTFSKVFYMFNSWLLSASHPSQCFYNMKYLGAL